MTDLATKLAKLPKDKREALLRRLAAGRSAEPVLGPRTSNAPVPAAVQQQQLWFIDRMDQQAAANNLAYVWILRGRLDVDALRAALASVVGRHESLRASLVAGDPVDLRVADDLDWRLDVEDLTTADDPEAAFAVLADELRGWRFRLDRSPLFRAVLARTAEDEHRLIWVVHHIAWDAGSVGVFLNDLSSAFNGAGLARPELNYRDYAAWQHARLKSKRGALAKWWRDQLRDCAPTELPTDHARPAEQTFGGDAINGVLLEGAALERFRRLCDEQRVTAYMALVGTFTHLLGRWTRTEDVLIGSPFGLRPDPRLEDSVGFYVNMLPIRCAGGGERSLRDQLTAARESVLDAIDHRELPFSEIVAAVNPPRDLSRTPLFQIELAYEADTVDSFGIGFDGLEFAHQKLHDGGSRFDLSLIVRDAGDRLGYTVEYNPDLFQQETIQSLVDSFRVLLDNATARPDVQLNEHDLVTAQQRGELVRLADGGAADEFAPTVWDSLLRHETERPDAAAVGTLTYAELTARSRAVAARLAALGVGRGDRVVLLARQSEDAVVGMLGTHLLGAAYVPLDVDAPVSRLRQIADQATASAWLVGETEVFERLERAHVPSVEITSCHTGEFGGLPQPDDSAYVIFTSGTTGNPKGVEVPHSALAHFCAEINRAYRIGPGDRVLGFARPSFDVSVFEVFATLAAGATLCLPDLDTRRDPALLGEFLRAERITVAELPPALMPQLDPDLPDLRLVSVGGEAFRGSLVAEWASADREFWNGYGPTETTVAVTLKRCEGEWKVNPPIGRPMRGYRAHVVDAMMRAVPRGAAGELVIAGPCVALGYLGDPEQTARVFVAEPGADGERAYRTGDLVRWRGDDDLDFLGRADRQVKINGFRVELAEVERALTDHESVTRACAAVFDVPELGRIMVGFVVGSDAEDAEVLRHVGGLLPRYAVPARLVRVDDIPLTPNGKVDQTALERLLRKNLTTQPVAQPVRELTETERILVEEVIGPVLLRAGVDPDISFFELGGNSLQATQVTASISRRFDVGVTIGEFFRDPTARGLAVLVDGKEKRSDKAGNRLHALLAEETP
ncbi:amino acid adenylation domain-containing protein [Streptomyces sp. ID05-26A]|nr:amino acid adenylation domain-containing protein [Streptomyces sp. ID05-26A]